MTDAKTEILARIRDALGPAPHAPTIPRAYDRAGTRPTDDTIDRFCERAAEYRATVHRTTPAGIPNTVRATLTSATRIGTPANFPPLGLQVIQDNQLSIAQLDRLDAVVTGSTLAIAETGTIILDSSPRCGRRALTLIPDPSATSDIELDRVEGVHGPRRLDIVVVA